LTGVDLTDEIATQVSNLCGAVAVSVHPGQNDIGYNTIKKFTDLGMKQVNIHLMVSQETLESIHKVIDDRQADDRLRDMNAIVFLGVKPKGRAIASGYQPITTDQYKELIQKCLAADINFGFDSCSAPKFEKAVKNLKLSNKVKNQMITASESCESSLFSAYINVFGEYWHCSFAEGEQKQTFVDTLQSKDFLRDIWYSYVVEDFRNKCVSSMKDGCRLCTVFPDINP